MPPILENYSQGIEDVQEGLTDDDYDMYYEIWRQFDPDGTQCIHYDQLSDFLDVLEPPLQIHKPNKYKIVSMDILICKGDLMFCADILDALIIDFFARMGYAIDESAELAEMSGRPNVVVSSTLWRQREEYAVRVIQNAWRKHKRTRGDGATGTDEGADDVADPDADGDAAGTGDGDSETGGTTLQVAVLAESDGFVIKNGQKVVLHSLTPSPSPADV